MILGRLLCGEDVTETVPESTASEWPDQSEWPDEYENILEFYFWEPQHLNRFSPPAERRLPLNTVFERLRVKEVPLNHLFTIFFSLAPAALSARLISAIAPGITCNSAYLINIPRVRRSKLPGICQPDLVFMADARTVFLELKIRARTSIEQILKYALAGEVIRGNRDRPPALVFVGKSPTFAEVDVFEAQREAASFVVPAKIERYADNLNVSLEQLIQAAHHMPVFRTSYTAIRSHLSSELETISAQAEGGETLRRLVKGMIRALDNPSCGCPASYTMPQVPVAVEADSNKQRTDL